MKTQIIPRRCSPHPGLHRSLTCYVPLYCPQTPLLSPLSPLPFNPSFSSISISLSSIPHSIFPQCQVLPSCQWGKVWRGDSNTYVHTLMHEYTYTKHMVLKRQLDYKGCVTFAAHTQTHTHTQSGRRLPQLCFALLHLAAWLKLSSGYPGCWDQAALVTHTLTQRQRETQKCACP